MVNVGINISYKAATFHTKTQSKAQEGNQGIWLKNYFICHFLSPLSTLIRGLSLAKRLISLHRD